MTAIKMHSVENRFVIGPSHILFGSMYVCTFQPGNFTGWGSDRVKRGMARAHGISGAPSAPNKIQHTSESEWPEQPSGNANRTYIQRAITFRKLRASSTPRLLCGQEGPGRVYRSLVAVHIAWLGGSLSFYRFIFLLYHCNFIYFFIFSTCSSCRCTESSTWSDALIALI